jgi:1-aminocyclopropane-1-carboxylate deaminase/D-cysteine desulfhydrase-like pyridoxal-dependent ACC family enzyme
MTSADKLERLRAMVDAVPRVRLADLPTPLQEVPRFSRALRLGASSAPRIFIKRDDLTGLAFGGNKTRMFEFLLAKAMSQGADTIVGGAGVQSNYCRQLAAASNALGLETHLVLRRVRGPRDDDIQGNLLLDLLAGAHVRIVRGGEDEQKKAMYDLADRLRAEGKKPFVARMANDADLTPDVIGYVECYREIAEQCARIGIDPSRIYLATYDTTQAGLELGRVILESSVRIVGVAPGVWKSNPRDLVTRCANQAAQALGAPHRLEPKDVYNTTDFVGKGYGIPTRESLAMLKLLARTEGIFLDPVYTSKAMAALHAHIRDGEISASETVLFLHTGGQTALFAYVNELDPEELRSRLDVD